MVGLRETLAEKVKKAFDDTSYPGDDKIIREEVQSFRRIVWKDVSLELIRSHRSELPGFSPQAFSYYLPAFLLAILLNTYEGDTLPDSVVMLLAPPDPTHNWRSWFEKMVASLNLEQKKVINEFIANYKQLEPHGDWYIVPTARERLEKAILFWREEVGSGETSS